MRKYLLTLFIFIAGFRTLHAQLIKVGGEIGIHSANVIENNSIPGWDTAVKPFYSSRTALHFGLIAEIPISKIFFFQPGMNYTSKGRQYIRNTSVTDSSSLDTVYTKNTLNIGYIEMPFYLTLKLPLSKNRKNSFFVGAGPYFSFIYNGSLTSQMLTQQDTISNYSTETDKIAVGNASGKYKTFDFGVNAKAGFEFGNITLSGYMSHGLTSFYEATYPSTFKHQVMGVSLGIWLSKTASPASTKKAALKDTDKDGIPDDQDMCPLQPGFAKYHGCPVPDTDGDGIDDEHDSCKTVPGVARYHGCPVPDTDGDGIDDEHDSCKTVPGVARYHGCPIPDRDHDGINDEVDKCPDVPGVAENNGCPEIKKEIKERVNFTAKNILFAIGSDRLSILSYKALDQLALLLITHPELHLTIEGYTDITGTPELNQNLSQQRANVVKKYLIKKGLQEKNITATGFGERHPIADNNTINGQEKNRRVELKVMQQ
jgi:OmpA-OmpF porin, OOP family